jgi:pilus assembly protein CpaB
MYGDRRYRFVFYVALLVAGLATVGVYRVIDGMRATSRIETQDVVIAAADVPEGTRLTLASVALVQLPIAAVPAGAYSSTDTVVGRVSRIPIFKGEAIVPGRLAPEGTAGGIEVKIMPGKRAMAVRIDDVAGIAGMVQPNSRVDVMLTTTDATAQRAQVSKLFMSNMRVLSVGARVTRGDDGQPINAPTVTLEVTPEEAERLALATREGAVQLVLRGYGDPDSVKTSGAKRGDLLTQVENGPAPASSRGPRTVRTAPRPARVTSARAPAVVSGPEKTDSVVVRVYRGDQLSSLKFEQARGSARRDSVRRDSVRREEQRRRDPMPPSLFR